MRHRNSGRKLDMDATQRKAMFRNMTTSLLLHGQIRTTEPRAKELRRFAERMISIGKRAPSAADLAAATGDALARARADRVSAIRRLKQWLQSDEEVERVMGEYADRFRTRPGGYTRVVKLGRRRPGDNAKMAVLQLVEQMGAVASGAPDRRPATMAEPPAEAAPQAAHAEATAAPVESEAAAPVESESAPAEADASPAPEGTEPERSE
jgi:large subunit ribosomal protein L17